MSYLSIALLTTDSGLNAAPNIERLELKCQEINQPSGQKQRSGKAPEGQGLFSYSMLNGIRVPSVHSHDVGASSPPHGFRSFLRILFWSSGLETIACLKLLIAPMRPCWDWIPRRMPPNGSWGSPWDVETKIGVFSMMKIKNIIFPDQAITVQKQACLDWTM